MRIVNPKKPDLERIHLNLEPAMLAYPESKPIADFLDVLEYAVWQEKEIERLRAEVVRLQELISVGGRKSLGKEPA